jgi:molecular chaperone GrpE
MSEKVVVKSKKKANKKPKNDLDQQLAELTDALQRERADALNAKKRFEEEKAELSSYNKAELVKELLPTLDSAQKALSLINPKEELGKEVAGLVAVVKKLEQTLSSLGLKKIEAKGRPFDPELHEAVMFEEGDGSGEELVVEELQPGYTMFGRVIRHSMVKVSK